MSSFVLITFKNWGGGGVTTSNYRNNSVDSDYKNN